MIRIVQKLRISTETGCWVWCGHRDSKGYGQVWLGGTKALRRRMHLKAHRMAYEAFRGQIPNGLTIDHLCMNPACCNPWHMEPVTASENAKRAARARTPMSVIATHCPKGHEYTPTNSFINPSGTRRCRTCRNESSNRCKRRMAMLGQQ